MESFLKITKQTKKPLRITTDPKDPSIIIEEKNFFSYKSLKLEGFIMIRKDSLGFL